MKYSNTLIITFFICYSKKWILRRFYVTNIHSWWIDMNFIINNFLFIFNTRFIILRNLRTLFLLLYRRRWIRCRFLFCIIIYWRLSTLYIINIISWRLSLLFWSSRRPLLIICPFRWFTFWSCVSRFRFIFIIYIIHYSTSFTYCYYLISHIISYSTCKCFLLSFLFPTTFCFLFTTKFFPFTTTTTWTRWFICIWRTTRCRSRSRSRSTRRRRSSWRRSTLFTTFIFPTTTSRTLSWRRMLFRSFI